MNETQFYLLVFSIFIAIGVVSLIDFSTSQSLESETTELFAQQEQGFNQLAREGGLGSIDTEVKQWNFNITFLDELNVTIAQINDTSFVIIPTSVNTTKTDDINYRWKMVVNYTDDRGDNITEQKRVDRNNSELDEPFTFSVPEDTFEFRIEIGESSTVIDAGAAIGGISGVWNEAICITSDGVIHVAYQATGSDVQYGNSSDGGSTWSTKELDSGINKQSGIVCTTNDEIWIYYIDTPGTNDIRFYNSTDGGVSFQGATVFEDGGDKEFVSCVPNEDGEVECCIIRAGDRLQYGNTTNLNAVHQLSAGVANYCDIEVDSSGDTYIIISDTDTDDLTIMSDIDEWATRIIINESMGAVSTATGDDGISFAIDRDGKFHTAGIFLQDLWYCNSTTWNSGWSCRELDTDASFAPEISVTEDGGVHILYQTDTTGSGSDLLRANATDQINWEIRQEILGGTPSASGVGQTAHTVHGSGNNITDILHFVFMDMAAAELNYFNYTVAFTGGVDSCTYTSGTWIIQCADNCRITSNVEVDDGSDVIIQGASGTIVFAADVDISPGNLLYGDNGCILAGVDGSSLT